MVFGKFFGNELDLGRETRKAVYITCIKNVWFCCSNVHLFHFSERKKIWLSWDEKERVSENGREKSKMYSTPLLAGALLLLLFYIHSYTLKRTFPSLSFMKRKIFGRTTFPHCNHLHNGFATQYRSVNERLAFGTPHVFFLLFSS